MIAPLFKWGPISPKQLKVLTWWREGSPVADKEIIICEGAIRSGKTIPMSLSFVEWAFATFDEELFGITGKTIGALRQNVILPLKKILKGRGYSVQDKRVEKVLVVKKNGKTNYFELFGGKDESSQDLIQGRTLAGLLCDEVALQPQSFVNQAIGRCSLVGSKIWFNCNPEGPKHWFKEFFINKFEELNAFHLHFDMDDNWTLSKAIKDRYKRMFSGVFYKRFILGLWVMAEGLIYDIWDEDEHLVNSPKDLDRFIIGVDYGTTNPCVFGLYGWKARDPKKRIYKVKEYYYSSKSSGRQKTDSQYADDIVEFIGDTKLLGLYVDPSAASFIAELRSRGLIVKPADNSVLDGIRFVATFLQTGRFFVDVLCKMTALEFGSYSWDQKAQAKGEDKPIKDDDHTMDETRYALFTHFSGTSYVTDAL